MPVTIGQSIPQTTEDLSDTLPDVVTVDGKPLTFAPTFWTAMPLVWPANFDQLPKEEQEKIKNQYKFGGIKLRFDIKDSTVPITRETLDIP